MHKSSRPQPRTPPSPEPTTTATSNRTPEIQSSQKTSADLEPASANNRRTIDPKTPPEPGEKPGDLENASQSSYHPEDGEISFSPDEDATYIKNIRTPPEPVPNSPAPALDEKEPEQDKSKIHLLVETTEAKPQKEEEKSVKSDDCEKIGTIGTGVANLEEMPKTDNEVADEEVVEPEAPEPETSAQLTSDEEQKSEPTTSIEKQEPIDAQVESTQAITIPKIEAEPKPTADSFLLDSIIDSVILKSQTSENPPLASLNQNLNVEGNVKESTLASVGSQSPISAKAKSKQSWMHLSQMDTNETTNELKGNENRATLGIITSN